MKKQIRETWVDRVYRSLAPVSYTKRLIARQQAEIFHRQYDAAQTFSHSSFNRNSNSANREIRPAIKPIRENARDLIRNAAFAQKGVSAIVTSTVGWGIEASITHYDSRKQEQIRDLWAKWSSGLCSIDGSDFNSLQSQVMASMVIDGEVVVRELSLDNSIRLQVLESDHINSTAATAPKDFRVVNGVVVDRFNRPQGFHLYKQHPGDGGHESELVSASECFLVYRQDRPGQLRGVSWLAPVATSLKMLADLQYTQLVRLKLSAAITGVVTQEPTQLTPEQLLLQREADFELSPGEFKFLNPGESINFPSIPNPEGFQGSIRLALQEISAGLGITYEALSGDLSQVNFSSGRMGALQQRANVEAWRWHTLIPRFLNPSFERFKKFCAINGVDASECSVEWSPPAAQMISPESEVNATKNAIRAGLQTLPGALRELGLNPDKHLKELSDTNKQLDQLGLILDSDPRLTGNGQLQSAENLQSIKSTQE